MIVLTSVSANSLLSPVQTVLFFFARCLFFWSRAKHYKVNLAWYWMFLHSFSRVSLWFWGGVRLNPVTVFEACLLSFTPPDLMCCLVMQRWVNMLAGDPGVLISFLFSWWEPNHFVPHVSLAGCSGCSGPSLTYTALGKIQPTFEDPSEVPHGFLSQSYFLLHANTLGSKTLYCKFWVS